MSDDEKRLECDVNGAKCVAINDDGCLMWYVGKDGFWLGDTKTNDGAALKSVKHALNQAKMFVKKAKI